MTGHIYINGQIGSTEESRGVELQDVVMQVEANKEAEVLHIHINSEGGSVRVGKLIADYISKLPMAITIAEEFCASMGTEIHLARPLHQRLIKEGTTYLIHCPLIQNISGNSDELAEAAEYIKQTELSMLNMYHKATGLDKTALSGLMKQETGLSADEAINLGFASAKTGSLELKAVAFIEKEIININKNNKKMNLKEKVVAAITSAFDQEDPKAMVVATDNGELSYASEGELPEVGEAVMLGEEVAPDGNYKTEADFTIVVAEGVVTEIVEPEVIDVEALKAEISELKSQLEAKSTEVEEVKAEAETKAIETVEAEIVAFKKEIKSKYQPIAKKEKFNKQTKELTLKEKAAARKEELKNK
jgi:ATP-dependent protease ClpP protease subunit